MPLLIGGATTSRVHTAVKIHPNYRRGQTVYVNDASRAVGVTAALLSADKCAGYIANVRTEYARIAETHARSEEQKRRLKLIAARANALKLDWGGNYRPTRPRVGTTALRDFPLAGLVPYIDWSPFFSTWELKGRYPDILKDPTVGTEAAKLLRDAQALLERIVKENLFTARGAVGIYPASAIDGDDIEVYTDPARHGVRAVLRTLRQQNEKPPGRPNLALSDFIAPKTTGLPDWIGAFAVTTGHGLEPLVRHFESQHDDYNSIMAKALADRLAEAFAERLHERVRRELWGYARDETLGNDELIAEKYRGIRPAPGYPACPDHTEKRALFDLLDVTAKTGITLTESYAMWPAAAVSGWYFAHPDAHYFGVGRIGKDQVTDYARRKGATVKETERWLAPILNYDPDA
jgi:5-methyltetrahydrofolate--homocysteine methyltransferase